MFTAFLPGASKDALKRMSEEIRSWRIHLRTGTTGGHCRVDQSGHQRLDHLLWPVFRTVLNPLLERINSYLVRWAK